MKTSSSIASGLAKVRFEELGIEFIEINGIRIYASEKSKRKYLIKIA